VSGTSKGAVVGGGRRYPTPWPHHSQGSGQSQASGQSQGPGQSQGSGQHHAVSAPSGPGWASDALSALRDLTGLGV